MVLADFFAMPLERQLSAMGQAAHAALERWGLSGAQLSLIKHRENAVYRVETSTRQKFALRVHRLGYHSDQELRSELQWMHALKDSGISTATVVPTLDGSLFCALPDQSGTWTFQVDLLGWVDGEALGSIEEGANLDPQELADVYQHIGVIAAKTHNHFESWDKPTDFARHAWDLEGLVGDNPFWGRFWELEALTADQKELMLRVRSQLREDLGRFGTATDRYGVVHADFLPENFLVNNNGITLIDFDDAGYGWHLFDLATSLWVLLGEDYFDAVTQSLIDGYRTQRALPDDHVAMLPTFLMARITTYLRWVHTRSETETAKELTGMIVDAACAVATDYLHKN